MDRQADKKSATDAPRRVDGLGLRCPLPALRLARAVREQGPGRYLLLADDPAAQGDIPALCAERGWILLEAAADRFLVGVGSAA
jgi:tRNA 2-thiouridine synthesizing protein A